MYELWRTNLWEQNDNTDKATTGKSYVSAAKATTTMNEEMMKLFFHGGSNQIKSFSSVWNK